MEDLKKNEQNLATLTEEQENENAVVQLCAYHQGIEMLKLIKDEPLRHGQLLEKSTSKSPSQLQKKIVWMEDNCFMIKIPIKPELEWYNYTISEHGLDFLAFLKTLATFGKKHNEQRKQK